MNSVNTYQILEAIGDIAPAEIAKRWDRKRGTCIASTAIGLIVLKRFGIAVEPVCVEMIVGNAEYGKWFAAGCPDFASEDEARASGVKYVRIDTERRGPGLDGYAGHLVIGMRERQAVIDLTLGQFRRPHKRIEVPDSGLLHTTPAFWQHGEPCVYYSPHCCIVMQLHDNPPDWTVAPDWWKYTHQHHEVAKKIVRKVIRRLYESRFEHRASSENAEALNADSHSLL